MKQIHFFGLRKDLLTLLELVQRNGILQAMQTGNFLKEDFIAIQGKITSIANIPHLGNANEEQTVSCHSFLVFEPSCTVESRWFRDNKGRERCCIDQLKNPDTVVFTPAGIWNEDVVLAGSVSTVSQSPTAQSLMKRFHGAIKKTFTKVNAYFVGPEALLLLKSGKRLTNALQSPSEYDLTWDNH